MTPLRDLFTKLFKKKGIEKPWLEFYSREERSIKFTDKTIYNYMIDEVGEDKNFIALNYFGSKISYNEFFYNIDMCSKSLREFGVREGDIVTICMPNMPEAICSFYACNKIGAVADMVHPLSSPEQLLHYLKESKSRILILVDFDYDKFKDIIKETLVYKTVLVSPKESMPVGLSIGYTITRGIATKKPKFNDTNYMTWKEFLAKGVKNKDNYIGSKTKEEIEYAKSLNKEIIYYVN